MENIITVVVISVAVPLFCQLLYFLKAKEEKKHRGEIINRTKMPTAIYVFFLLIAFLLFAAGLAGGIIAIADKEPLSVTLILMLGFDCFSALSFFGFVYSRFRYEIFDDEKITVVRFAKTKELYFKDIAYYSYFTGLMGELTAYDKYGIKLFGSESINIGIEDLHSKFISNNIEVLPKDFLKRAKDNNETYKRYYVKSQLKQIAWIMFGFGLATLVLVAIIATLNERKEFENYPVTGTVESYSFKDNSITIKLKDDNSSYLITSITFKIMDSSFKDDISENEEILLYIGYSNGQGNKIISQIEYKGKIYLSADDAQAAEDADYRLGTGVFYVFITISCIMLAAWVVLLIVNKVKYGKPEETE